MGAAQRLPDGQAKYKMRTFFFLSSIPQSKGADNMSIDKKLRLAMIISTVSIALSLISTVLAVTLLIKG